jgi:FkbM family methyltransferase
MADPLFELLAPQRLTAVVDIGANPIDGDPPYKRMLEAGLCTLVGFEPQADALAELNRRKGPRERYLPAAVGDGGEHTLHVCHARVMTSLLAPDPAQLALFNEFPTFGQVVGEMQIATRRLDDIDEVEQLDFLKIDAQGAELDVFNSGRHKLARAVVIQTEVSFVPLYKGQPGLGAIDVALRELGFVPHCLAELKLWPISPLVVDGNLRKPLRQLLEADLVYVRNFTRSDDLDGEQWKHLAMVAHHCYGSADLALRAVMAATDCGAVPKDAAQSYLGILGTPKPSHQ